MNILDYIILGAFVISLVIGIIKGLLKQVFAVVGVIVVFFGSAFLAPYVQNWFANLIESEGTRMVIATVASAVILSVLCGLVSLLLRKIITKSKAIGLINRIFGGVLALLIAYLIISVSVELVCNTGENFLPRIKSLVGGAFSESWIVNNIYKNNFFGHWVVNGIAQKILDGLRSSSPEAFAGCFQFVICQCR